MGKFFWLLLVFALTACAAPASAPAPTSSPTLTPLPVAKDKLTFVDFFAVT